MQNHSRSRLVNISLLLGFALLLLYVTLRAYHLSFTHDESLSYLILKGDRYWLESANNHLLNTRFMLWSSMLFGYQEWALRLPNILSFVVYCWACWRILRGLKSEWLIALGFGLFLLNAYLLEFFALARGYGLSIAFMMLSLSFLALNPQRSLSYAHLLRSFAMSSIFAVLATYANLTLINFLIAVIVLNVLRVSYYSVVGAIRPKRQYRFYMLLVALAIVLLGFLQHLFQLKDLGQLYFGAGSFREGLYSLLDLSIYLPNTPELLIIGFLWAVGLSLLIGPILVIRQGLFSGPLFRILTLLGLIGLGLFVEHWWFEAKFPTNRTALFYWPLLSLYFLHLIQHLWQLKPSFDRFFKPLVMIWLVGILVNFGFGINISQTTNWTYDAHTKAAMQLVQKELASDQDTAILSGNWLFKPTVNYYRDSWNLNLQYRKAEELTKAPDFIYELGAKQPIENYRRLQSFKDPETYLLMKVTSD